jgi:transcription antitermination factor NusG
MSVIRVSAPNRFTWHYNCLSYGEGKDAKASWHLIRPRFNDVPEVIMSHRVSFSNQHLKNSKTVKSANFHRDSFVGHHREALLSFDLESRRFMRGSANQLSNHTPELVQNLRDIPYWYAVCTYPRHEKAVTEQLEAKCIETFLPTLAIESRRKDRRAQIKMPAFPGYVFIRITKSERSAVFSAPGVVRILSYNGVPAPIDESEIEAVKLCLKRGATLAVRTLIDVGERVRVRSGMLEGVEGLVVRCKNERTLIVPVSLINQSIAVEVDADLLEPLNVLNN